MAAPVRVKGCRDRDPVFLFLELEPAIRAGQRLVVPRTAKKSTGLVGDLRRLTTFVEG